ncbi:MAG: DUF3244 domain-containing protein [Sphingobacteriia bacterium]|jgi:hypothetical protein|nr:DUF3244 domain-containing protein [Sphingobacteriia bacterium]
MKKIFSFSIVFLLLAGGMFAQTVLPQEIILKRNLIGDVKPPIPKSVVPVPFEATYSASQLTVTALETVGSVQIVVINRNTGAIQYNQMQTFVANDVITISTYNWSSAYYTINIYYGNTVLSGSFLLE